MRIPDPSPKVARALGRQLERARIVRYDSPKVRYSLHGEQVSAPMAVDVAWVQGVLIVGEDPGPRLEDAIVFGLCERMGAADFERLLRQCYCRDADWIRRSVGTIYELEVSEPDGEPLGPHIESPGPPGRLGSSEPPGLPHQPPAGTQGHLDVLERVGFTRISEGENVWEREDERVWGTDDSVFPWAYASTALGERKAYLVRKELRAGTAVKLPFEVWDRGPRVGAVLLAIGGGIFRVLPFEEIRRGIEKGVLNVTVRSVRLRWLTQEALIGSEDDTG